MIGFQRYPFEHEPYASTPKTIAFKHASEKIGLEWFLPPLAVTFGNEGEEPRPGQKIEEKIRNLHDRDRVTCQLCGECDVGCNFGAKNTLDYNYLTHAKHHGAEIRVLCDVRTIEPRDGGGYAVGYLSLEDPEGMPSRNGRPVPLTRVTCDDLVLSAGTLGTTNLLLRNRSAFPRLSRKLGSRFCGNGDLLTLALNCGQTVEGRRVPRIIDPGYGPVITSTARMADALDGHEGRGFYMQDAGYPQHLAWILHTLAAPKTLWNWRSHGFYLVRNWLRGSPDTDVTGHLAELLKSAELSAGGLPMLGMGRDVPDGKMFLHRGHLDVDWKRAKSDDYFQRLRSTGRAMAHALGGRFADSPIWFLKRVITVHPLGGAPMGRSSGEGVVDPYGNVYGYPGLHIADGSVMPGPVGPNPSFTIAALADRFSDRMLETTPAAEAAAT
jgi:cholesterol oxidase